MFGGIFGFIAWPLGYIMEWIYLVVNNYGWTLIIFTIVVKLLMFPLSIKGQKSTAKMTAYQPLIQEVQKKWANDKQRQQEEMVKLQQEYGISMGAGCLPMLAPMVILFGLIDVIYYPLQWIFHISKDMINAAITSAGTSLSGISPFIQQSQLINLVSQNPEQYREFFGDKTEIIASFNFNFFGIDLSKIPTIGWDMAAILTLIIPVLSIVTMIASQLIFQKMSGQQVTGMMKWLPWIMSLMFVSYGFTVPVGFSLYYTMSNLTQLIQSIVLKKMYDPEDYKRQLMEEIERKKAEKKKKKQVVIKTVEGAEETKEVTESELLRIRLAKAREIDAQRYTD